MTDVEIAHDEGERGCGAERRETLVHRVEEGPLLVLAGSFGLAGVHVGADDREALPGDDEVGLDPAAGGIELGRAQLGAHGGHGGAGEDGDAGAPLRRRLVSDDLPPGQRVRELVGVGAHLLQREHVDLGGVEPFDHPLADGGPDAVDVDGGDAKELRHARQPNRAIRHARGDGVTRRGSRASAVGERSARPRPAPSRHRPPRGARRCAGTRAPRRPPHARCAGVRAPP